MTWSLHDTGISTKESCSVHMSNLRLTLQSTISRTFSPPTGRDHGHLLNPEFILQHQLLLTWNHPGREFFIRALTSKLTQPCWNDSVYYYELQLYEQTRGLNLRLIKPKIVLQSQIAQYNCSECVILISFGCIAIISIT